MKESRGGKKGARVLAYLALGAIMGCLALLLADLTFRVAMQRRIANRIGAMIAAGQPTELADLAPPEIPNSENAGTLYMEACSVIEAIESNKTAPDEWTWEWLVARAYSEEERLSPAQRELVVGYLQEVRPAVERVQAAEELIRCRLAGDYWPIVGGPDGNTFHDIGTLRHLERCVCLAALSAAQDGDIGEALGMLAAGLRMAEGVKHQPDSMSQMMGNACAWICFKTLQSVLDQRFPPEIAAERLLAQLGQLRDRKHLLWGLQGDRCVMIATFDRLRDMGSGPLELRASERASFEPWSFIDRTMLLLDEVAYLDLMARAIEIAARPRYESREAFEQLLREIEGMSKFDTLATVSIPAINGAHQAEERLAAQCDLAEIAIRLKHYQGKTGSYPAELQDIVPEFLPALHVDRFSGDPYTYKREGDGFVIYSVGVNGQDDGGDPDRKDGDIVWRSSR